VFYKNPEPGKVKTRLAATVGEGPALRIYERLCEHTRQITRELSADRALFYSENIDLNDGWPPEQYMKYTQAGKSLGDRMSHAFQSGFGSGYTAICIIGTDCYELTPDIIRQAFARLERFDAVIGPAFDGGYYLLGMTAFHPALFSDKQWSTSSVLGATLADFEALGLSHYKLPQLHDVDQEADIPSDLRYLLR
jgi:rSAM/selenodomain-associated transferase 1